ncbi:MAG TPA: hypothetical protein DCS43_05490 [Verrucomicrobia bacterium]|nr:hypothetical protein [Verrucomicrobiota bacterium]
MYVKILGNMTSTVAITNHSGVVVGPFTNTVAIASTRFLSPDRDDFAVSPFSITHNWPPVDPATTNTVGVSIAITNLTVILDADGTILDSATNVVLRFNYAGPYIAGALSLTPESWQTIDPRCNWHQRGWTNAPATFSPDWRRGLHNAGQAGKRVYTSEKGVLYSPLELGHLLCLGGQTVPGVVETEWVPWREFKVYGSGRHKLMEHFTTLVPGVRKGLVNANSEDTNLLKLVFEQLPVPTPPMAGAAADYVVAQNRADKFKNVSDMLDSEWQTDLVSAGLDNDVKADLLLAYSTGLLGVRQNLFLVVVAASGASQGMGSGGSAGVAEVDTRNSKRAMAVVWRDPVKNSVGQYDCFVRMFKWLD